MQRNVKEIKTFFIFFSEAGYSRQTGILDFRYLWPNSFISTGIQIQGNSFRIVFSHEIDAFKKVFCISKWTGNYSKFKDKLDDKKNTDAKNCREK